MTPRPQAGVRPHTTTVSLYTSRDQLTASALLELRPGLDWTPAELLLARAFAEALRTYLLTSLNLSTQQAGPERWWYVTADKLAPGCTFALGFMAPVEDASKEPQLHIRATIAHDSRTDEFTARMDADGLVCSSDGQRHATEAASGAGRIVRRWLDSAIAPASL